MYAVGFRQFAIRHVKRSKHDIEQREGGGEVFVQPFALRRMVPAVKDGAGEDIFEWAESPVQVCMHHSGIAHIEYGKTGKRRGRKATDQHDRIGHDKA